MAREARHQLTYELSRRAKRDLQDFLENAADHPHYVRRIAKRIDQILALLNERPLIGPLGQDRRVRVFPVTGTPFRAVYIPREKPDGILVVRLFHTSRVTPDDWFED